jgi:Ca2+-binding RTX toxin-like protein
MKDRGIATRNTQIPMKNTDMTATRFLMRLPAANGQVRELVIEGTGLTYAGSGALTGGTITSIVLITSDSRSGDTMQTWTSAGITVANLNAVMGNGFWNHVNTIGGKFAGLLQAYPIHTDGGTGGTDGDTGGTGGTGGGGDLPPTGSTIMGTPDKDRLRGTDLGEKIDGKEDDDRIHGRGGDDTIMGGSGDDRIRGDNGNDQINGNAGDDRMRGGKGNDLIIDTQGNNHLHGDSGNDTLQSGGGNDVMIGGKGDDVIVSGGGKDFAMGGAGADVFVFDGENTGKLDIKGFDTTVDRLDVAGLNSAAAELRAFLAEAQQAGDDVIWQHGGMTVILHDAARDEIGLTNFLDAEFAPVALI